MADASMPNMAAPFNALIAGNQAAPVQNPLAMASQAVGLQNQMTAGNLAKYELATKQNDYMNGQFGALLQKPDLSADDFVGIGKTLVQMGMPSEFVAKEVANIPPPVPGNPVATRQALRQYALDHIAKVETVQQQLDQHFGVPTQTNLGNRTVWNNVSQQNGVSPTGGPAGSQDMGTTPAERLAPQNITDANGQTIQTTAAQAAVAKGMDPVSGMPLQGAFTRGTKPPQAAPGATMPPAAGGAPEQSVGGIAGPGPGFGAGLDALNKDRLAASDTVQGMQPLLKALPLAQALGTTGTGPGTKPYNDAKAFLISQGVIKPDATVDAKNELDKYLAQAVAKSPLSGRSDMGTIVAQASNPNTTSQTNAATIGLIKNAIVQSRMSAAAPLAFNDNPSAYPQHKGTFLQKQDLRAYGLDFEPDGGRTLVQQMAAMPVSSPARTRFFESLKAAKTAGVYAGQQ